MGAPRRFKRRRIQIEKIAKFVYAFLIRSQSPIDTFRLRRGPLSIHHQPPRHAHFKRQIRRMRAARLRVANLDRTFTEPKNRFAP
jgi:hypothetical protein